jgi:RNA polymerase sigma-70 factor (ECF subfamily)
MATPSRRPGPDDFEALVERGQGPVTRYLLARTHSAAEAVELVQETFVRAYCALARGDRPRHPLPWLLAIARNVFVESVRKERHRREIAERLALLAGPGASDLWREQVEHRVVVGDAVDALPDELREPVLLHYFAGLPLSDVARHLEITPGAARTRLWRARQTLRGQLEGMVSETDRVGFVLPRDLAAKAKDLAERPPVYESLTVALQVGGTRWPTAPLTEPISDGRALSFLDVEFAIERLHAARLAGDRPLSQKLEFSWGLELFEHPRAVDVCLLMRSADVGNEAFLEDDASRILVSDGWRLGTDPSGLQLLKDFFAAGLVKWIWFTVAGYGDTHDGLCERPGAFAAITTAMERCGEAEIGPNWFILLSKRSAPEIGRLAETVVRIRGDGAQLPVFPAAPYQDESLWPEPEDLQGLPPQRPGFVWRVPDGFWTSPEQFTEGNWTQRARAGDLPETQGTGWHERSGATLEERKRALPVWVTPELDVFVYDDRPRVKLANLKTDPPKRIYQALANVPWPPAPPADEELVERYGNLESRRLYIRFAYLRSRWLEQWQKERQIAWLPWAW